MQVNQNNFLIWDDGGVTVGLPPVPFLYHQDRENGGALPVCVPTEAIGFYVNDLEGVFDERITNVKLDILDAQTGNIADTDIWEVEKHVVSQVLDISNNIITEEWNPWAIAVMPTLPDGVYRFRLRADVQTVDVPETKATAALATTTVPIGSTIVRVEVADPQLGVIIFLQFTRSVSETVAQIATKIALFINTGDTGYTAVALDDAVTVTARPGLGATINTVEIYIKTDVDTFSTGTFTGGVNATYIQVETNLLTSSYVRFCSDETFIENHTTYCRFRHDRYFYGIQYDDIPSFYNQFRLVMGLTDQQTETDKEIYREIHTGKPRTYQAYIDKVVTVEAYYFTPDQHLAASILFEMDYVELNQKRYRLKQGYKVNTEPRNKTNKGVVELLEEEFSSANRC